jgi:hypothetical protein
LLLPLATNLLQSPRTIKTIEMFIEPISPTDRSLPITVTEPTERLLSLSSRCHMLATYMSLTTQYSTVHMLNFVGNMKTQTSWRQTGHLKDIKLSLHRYLHVSWFLASASCL